MNEIQLDVNEVIESVSGTVAELVKENAVLKAQCNALMKKLQELQEETKSE